MSKHRLFVAQPISGGQELPVDGEQGHYLSRVLRLKPGTTVTVFDGSGKEFPSVILEAKRQNVLLLTGQSVLRDVESPLSIRLVQGISRGERMDFVVQKATELGVHRISPILTEFSVVKLSAERSAKRILHWKKIAISACEQCGRNKLPIIDEPVALYDFLRESERADCRLSLQPTATTSLQQVGTPDSSVELLIGPEGGINNAEAEIIAAAGFTTVSLGPRVLRTETAALAAVAIIQAQWGDL